MPVEVNTTIEKHYYGARQPWLAQARALTAAELGYPAYVHLHPYGAECVGSCQRRVISSDPR